MDAQREPESTAGAGAWDHVRLGKAVAPTLLLRDLAWKRGVEAADARNTELLRQLGRLQHDCTICGREAGVAFMVRGLPYRTCSECNHLFLGVMPTPDYLMSLYSEGLSAQDMAYVAVSDAERERRFEGIGEPKFRFIDSSASIAARGLPRGLWVDIGSGVGDLLAAAARSGYDVLGIEPDPVQAQVARGRGIPTVEAFIDVGQPWPTEAAEAQIITLLNVVEHFPDPVGVLAPLVERLSPGSFVAMEVPRHPSVSSVFNASGIGPIYRHANPPEHLNVFSDSSMRRMLDAIGLAEVAVWRFGSDALEAFTSIGAALGWEGGFDQLNQSEAVEALQHSIDGAGLSDVMLVVSVKPR